MMQRKIIKFEIGRIYETRFITQYDTKLKIKIVARTEKTIKWILLDDQKKVVKQSRPYIWENQECFKPLGNYSMSPTIFAGKPRW